jgi:acetylornithine deacetylase/succinyl-diaminopimelate desuccinylase-like protein
MFDRGIPSICYGLRGLVYFQIDLRGTKSDLHSGSFGGAVANPAFQLANILSQMKDRGGHVKVPGFYDDVRPITEAEREQWRRLPFNEKRYAKELRRAALWGETGYSTLERVWARPTFEVNGLLSGFTGEGAKTVIPAVAMAKGQHAPRSEPGSGQDRAALRRLREEGRAEDRRGQGDAHARREAVDDGLRQQIRAGRRPRHQAGLRPGTGVQPRRRIDSCRRDVPGNPGAAVSALRRRAARRERARPERKLDLGNFHGGIIASAFLYDEIAKG